MILITATYSSSFSFPKQYAHLSPVEEHEMFGLMRDVSAKSSANNAMPCRVVHGVEFSLYDLRNVVEDAFLLERRVRTVHGVLLHLLRHVRELHHRIFRLRLVLQRHVVHYRGLDCCHFIVDIIKFIIISF